MRRNAAAILVFEAFIALFFGLAVAKLHPSDDWYLALALGVGCVLLSGLMKHRWAYAVGWILQLGFLAAGFMIVDMFVLGAVFTALWWAGLYYGQKGEKIKEERMRAFAAE